MNNRIILASTSPRRKELLKSMRLEFEIMSSSFEEKLQPGEIPCGYTKRNSIGKALSLYNQLQNETSDNENLIIIGADTVVSLNEHILEKPKSEQKAFEMLSALSNKTHEVYTSFTIAYKKFNTDINSVSETVKTAVTFRELSTNEINSYIKTGEPMDKAGSYGIQGKAACFVSKINGSVSNVTGLPLAELYICLNKISTQ